jgi:hypothetical protein
MLNIVYYLIGPDICDAASYKFKHGKCKHWMTPARFASSVTWFSIIGYSQQSAQSFIGHFDIRYSVLIENDLQLLNPEMKAPRSFETSVTIY